jgi:tetratricopeptide (TPR) repeat protein
VPLERASVLENGGRMLAWAGKGQEAYGVPQDDDHPWEDGLACRRWSKPLGTLPLASVKTLVEDSRVAGNDLLEIGLAAFERGEWVAAAEALSSADMLPPAAHETLARSRWWLDDPKGAIAAWELAYRGYLEDDLPGRAALVAVTIAREYTSALGNAPAANGWLLRAREAAGEEPVVSAWVELAEAERTTDPTVALGSAMNALAAAKDLSDRDLEIQSLAYLGVCEVRLGQVSKGMDHLDSALAEATAGGGDPRVLGDVFCSAVEACTLSASMARLERWTEVFNDFMERHQHPPLLSFCMICDAEDQLANGQWNKAEETLLGAMGLIESGGQRARCIHPAALLAEVRVAQSRFEEAAQLMVGLETLPEMSLPRASLLLSRGEPAVAVAELHRRLHALGEDNLLAVPLLQLLVQAEIASRRPR